MEYVLEQTQLLDLDIVQLHGAEPVEWARLIPVPVIRSFKPGEIGVGACGYHAVPLLDSGIGGTGTRLDLGDVRKSLEKDGELKVLLAGGLGPGNVGEVLKELGSARGQVVGVDVSTGVEEDGEQSLEKIRDFVVEARKA